MADSILPYLREQLILHPAMESQDLAKLCYQAARGAEHLLADPQRARAYLVQEMEAVEARGDLPLYEIISPTVARVNLAPWKAQGLEVDHLFEMFSSTAATTSDGIDLLPAYLAEVTSLLSTGDHPVTAHEWAVFLRAYEGMGMPAIHHSEAYRLHNQPAYRIVRVALLRESGLI